MEEQVTREELLEFLTEELQKNEEMKERIIKNIYQITEMSNIEFIIRFDTFDNIIDDTIKLLS